MENSEHSPSVVGRVKKRINEKVPDVAQAAAFVGGNSLFLTAVEGTSPKNAVLLSAGLYGAIKGAREVVQQVHKHRFKATAPDDVKEILKKTDFDLKKLELDDFREKIVQEESEGWQETLGTKVEIKPLPSYIDIRMVRKLNSLGLALRYIPHMEFLREDLKRLTAVRYKKQLSEQFPNWDQPHMVKSYDYLPPVNTRGMPDKEYWSRVKANKTELPKLPGQWVAIETIPLPAERDTYKFSPLMQKLKIDSRRKGLSPEVVEGSANANRQELFCELRLSDEKAVLRLPTFLEWNLLANRNIWGENLDSEFTGTFVRERKWYPRQKEVQQRLDANTRLDGPGSWRLIEPDDVRLRFLHSGFRFGIFFSDESASIGENYTNPYHNFFGSHNASQS